MRLFFFSVAGLSRRVLIAGAVFRERVATAAVAAAAAAQRRYADKQFKGCVDLNVCICGGMSCKCGCSA